MQQQGNNFIHKGKDITRKKMSERTKYYLQNGLAQSFESLNENIREIKTI